MTINDGGPAFPAEYFDRALFEKMTKTIGSPPAHEYAQVKAPGMSLRDYFAAAALTGLLNPASEAHSVDAPIHAYAIADAMLAERSKA